MSIFATSDFQSLHLWTLEHVQKNDLPLIPLNLDELQLALDLQIKMVDFAFDDWQQSNGGTRNAYDRELEKLKKMQDVFNRNVLFRNANIKDVDPIPTDVESRRSSFSVPRGAELARQIKDLEKMTARKRHRL